MPLKVPSLSITLRQKHATCNVHASAIHLQKLPGTAHPIIHTDPDREMCSTMYLQSFILLLGLDEYTTFNVSVAANNSLGIGPYSRPVEVMTLESSKSIL